jgi:DNA polymerase
MELDSDRIALRSLLHWYADAGVDETVGADPQGLYAFGQARQAETRSAVEAPRKTIVTPVQPRPIAADEAISKAEAAARAAVSFEALAAAVADFEGCPLKAGARSTVFTDGTPGADLLVIGEAPGRDEDLAGKPFVGRAGQLLDRMLASINRSRKNNVLISNVIYWRPPGNRTPTQLEIATCKPFVERLIELTAPKAVLLAGGVPTQALLQLPGIMRARGQWRPLRTASGYEVPALPVFHPAFLLRQPGQKRFAWLDLVNLENRLRDA